MTTPFHVRRSVNDLSQQFSMPSGNGHHFATKADQMRYWLSDPILRADAVQWFEANGYEAVLSEYGNAIDYRIPTEPVIEPSKYGRSRYVS